VLNIELAGFMQVSATLKLIIYSLANLIRLSTQK